MTAEEQLAYLTKGCVDVVRPVELKTKLERAAASGTPLVVKVGFDPTAPDLHLGHTVLIRKMKHFQDLGHTVIFVIGDFTGMIGDPTGRSKTRPPLTREEIDANAETYKAQVFKLLDPTRTVVDFNGRWLQALGAEGWIRLAARYNVAQMLERRDFKQRYASGQPIAIHELLYPLAQAYDSVALRADVELGGTDQLFNLNVGRDIMPAFGLEPQVVMTTPLLEGLDGVEKMSKSLGNYVGVTEAPDEMFGKLMSISDELMWRYYMLLTDLTPAEVEALQARVGAGTLHPKQAKVELAKRVVSDFHSAAEAEAAADRFERRFARKELPDDVPMVALEPSEWDAGLPRIMVKLGLAESMGDARRKIEQGGVKIDGVRVGGALEQTLNHAGDQGILLQVGKRAAVRIRRAAP
jgi:tyrosyl-tRNA synthetase